MHPNIWPPYTQVKTSPNPLKVRSAQGIWLELEDGRSLIDCISSWWVNNHGHAHPKIAAAIAAQAQTLEQVIFSGLTHDPAEQLAEQLVQRLPGDLRRVFFSDNGSTAIEVALKMAYQYWQNLGQPRPRFLAFEGAYHGDTFGAMAVGERSVFTASFSDLLFEVEFVAFPATYLGDPHVATREASVLEQLQQKFAQTPHPYAGVLIEPLVQGAGGMRMCRPAFIQALREMTTDANTLLIFDEVMTGFGRTGAWFASDRAQVAPDIICLSKGITGGFLPFAVTVSTEAIFEAFYSHDPIKTLYHGHSYTANPLGCAAALAGLELMVENESKFSSMERLHKQFLEKLQSQSKFEQARVTGTIAAFNIISNQTTGYLNQIGPTIRAKAIEQGLLLRPLGNVLYIMPPYCITELELSKIYDGIDKILLEIELDPRCSSF